MNIAYILTAAKAMVDKAEKESANNLATAPQSFRLAAKKYREAAAADPSKKEEYISLAETCERKASGAAPVTPAQNGSNNASTNSYNGSANSGAATTNRTTAAAQNNNSQSNGEEGEVTLESALSKLDSLIGLKGVKSKVKSWVAVVDVERRRRERGLPTNKGFSYHLVFTGNPGTGKTTVARIMADIYKALGILQQGQLVETSRSDLVAGYVGQTAIKTREKIENALGGVLFIDEVYTLCAGGENDFGQEAIDELLKAMEDHREELVVIVAGYTDLMEKFLTSNPGLKSRMNTVIEFEDYTEEEMFKIFNGQCEKSKYRLTPVAEKVLKSHFKKLYQSRDKNFGNAREVRNIFQQIVLQQSARLYKIAQTRELSDDDFIIMTEEDVLNAISKDNSGVSVEYESVKNTVTEADMYTSLSQGNLGNAAVLVCTRLEALLKYVYKFEGELYEMVNTLRENQHAFGNKLTKGDFDRLYKIRTFRNNFVHSGIAGGEITPTDVTECIRIIKMLENK